MTKRQLAQIVRQARGSGTNFPECAAAFVTLVAKAAGARRTEIVIFLEELRLAIPEDVRAVALDGTDAEIRQMRDALRAKERSAAPLPPPLPAAARTFACTDFASTVVCSRCQGQENP